MLCLAAGALVVPLMTGALTIAWLHSVEKTRWEEDWREEPHGLALVESRVRGSGVGMEPGPDARFVDGVWACRPDRPPLPEVVFRRSGATTDWEICIVGRCRAMGSYVPADADPVALRPCSPDALHRHHFSPKSGDHFSE